MKHLPLFTVFLFALALSASAQFGIKYGVNASNFREGTDPDIRYKVSLSAGVYGKIKLGKALYLQPEAEYVSKGSLINPDPSGGRYRLNMNYVQAPLVFRIGGGPLTLDLGGYAGYLLDNMSITKWNWEKPIKEFKKLEGLEGFSRFQYGALGGLTMKWDWIEFTGRYEHGFQYCSPERWPLMRFKERNISFKMAVPLTGHRKG